MTKQQGDAPEPVSAEETASAIAKRDAIAKKFGHTTNGLGPNREVRDAA